MPNPKRTMARRSWVITALGLFLMFGPMNLGWLEGMHGGFALASFGLLTVVAGLTTFVIYHKLARQWDSILAGKDVLVRWTYSPDAWREYAEMDYRADKRNKMTLFLVVAAFALFFGVLFFIIDREAGFIVLLMMIGLIVLIRLTAYLSARFIYRQNLKSRGEVLITPRAVLLNKQLHVWGMLGATLEQVTYRPGRPAVIEFSYSAPSGRTTADHTVRVPVPPGEEKEAGRIQDFFRKKLGDL